MASTIAVDGVQLVGLACPSHEHMTTDLAIQKCSTEAFSRMPQFILIEQSLRNLGGHHYEYAVEVLGEAEAAGFKPILAINRDFKQLDRFPRHWRAIPVFPFRSDRIHRVPKATSYRLWQRLLQPGGSLSSKVAGIVEGIGDRSKAKINEFRWRRQRSRIAGFADACRALFEEVELRSDDHVYCSTVSDMDLLGLVQYLTGHPESEQATWHLQFHFGVFLGRDPDYDSQHKNVRRLRQRFERATRDLSNHNVHFYTTTDELRRQFNWFKKAEFQTLPWPVSKRFHLARSSAVAQRRTDWQSVRDGLPIRPTGLAAPLRLVCAGGVRREKGGELVGPLVNALDKEFLQTDKLQLLIQTGKKRKSQTMLGLEPGGVTEIDSFSSGQLPKSPVIALPHPLSPDNYADLIRSADIGLLLYDSDEYFARCSGILVELLAAGVPVIGPAGCWLGDQIEQANRIYLDDILNRSTTVSHWDLAGCVVSAKWFDTSKIRLQSTGANLLVRLAPSRAASPGVFARIRLEQFDDRGTPTGDLVSVVGASGANRGHEQLIPVLFHLEPATTGLRLTSTDAHRVAPPPLRQQDAFLINDMEGKRRRQPLGRIGLTIPSPEFIPSLLSDVVTHYEHYRQAAGEFACQWREEHAPARTIEMLTTACQPPRRDALRSAG